MGVVLQFWTMGLKGGSMEEVLGEKKLSKQRHKEETVPLVKDTVAYINDYFFGIYFPNL